MNLRRFTKPPLTPEVKEKKAEEFVSMTLPGEQDAAKGVIGETYEIKRVTPKDPMIPYALRLPKRVHDDLREAANITGISFNSICIEMLRASVKSKLRELRE